MVISQKQIRDELKKHCLSIVFADDAYVLPSFNYLTLEFLPWFGGHISRKKFSYTKERFDCDDFANEFKACLVEAGLGLEEQAAVAVGTLRARNLEMSLGIPKGEHALNIVGVKTKDGHGWLIIEPQNQKHVFIEDYTTADNLRATF